MTFAKTILVIDDEKDIAELIAEIVCTVPGRKVFNATTSAEAYARSVVCKFDLIIADFRMPKTNGADLVKIIRGQRLNSDTPILMISGAPENAASEMTGVDGVRVVAKPFMAIELLKAVEEMIGIQIAAAA